MTYDIKYLGKIIAWSNMTCELLNLRAVNFKIFTCE